MTNEFVVRLATADDAAIIGWHRAGMFRDMGQMPAHLIESFQATSTERVRQMLVSGEYIGWLAAPMEAPHSIVAGAGVQLRRVLPHPADEHAFAEGRQGVIINVFTEPEWRRKGLAMLLMDHVIRWARQQKLDRLLLHASEQGRSLYERLGFISTNEMKYGGSLGDSGTVAPGGTR